MVWSDRGGSFSMALLMVTLPLAPMMFALLPKDELFCLLANINGLWAYCTHAWVGRVESDL